MRDFCCGAVKVRNDKKHGDMLAATSEAVDDFDLIDGMDGW